MDHSRTTFEDAIENTVEAFDNPNVDRSTVSLMDRHGTINEVLARPYLIKDIHLPIPGTPVTTNWNPNNANSFTTKISLPSAILNDTNKMSKLEYFRYFTADMVIRIETNAQPYMSGKYWIFYDPYPDLHMNVKDLQYLAAPSITSYPGIEYDINQMSHAEIRIPFISYERAFDLENMADYCALYVIPLTAVRDMTTETALRMRIFGHFENIHVFGPTSKPNGTPKYYMDQLRRLHRITAEIQINTRKENKNSDGPVSSIATAVSTAAGALSKVPVVGEIASSVGWVADIVGGVASIFGFSKPTDTAPNTKISNIPGYGYSYVEGKDESLVLATRADNELGGQQNIFPTNDDEMDIQYVCKNPGVIDVFQYEHTDDNDKWLRHYMCTPMPKRTRYDPCKGYGASPTSAEYVSQQFQLWRGTICFKISVAKTPFHNGRLILAFDPSNKITDTPFDRIGKTYTAILDLSENSSIIIKIPFLSKKDYLLTYPNDSFDTVSTGTFSIGALSPLLAPDSVAPHVDIVVWKWMEDVEFAVPQACALAVASTLVPKSEAVEAEVQINIMNRDQEHVVVFNDPERDNDNRHAQENIGERIVNLRTLLRSARRMESWSTSPKSLDPFQTISFMRDQMKFYYADTYPLYFAYMYRFYRGGFCYKNFSTGGTFTSSSLDYKHGLNGFPKITNTPSHITYNELNPVHEVRVPFYSQTYRKVINNEWYNAQVVDYGRPTVVFNSDAPNNELYFAGDDNLSYGWLVGPPALFYFDGNQPPYPSG